MRWPCAARAMNSFSYLRKNQKKKTPTLVLKKKTYGQDLVVLSCFRSFELAEFLDYRIEGPHDSNCSLTVNRPSQFPLQETGGIKRRQFAVNCTICTALSKCHVSTWLGQNLTPSRLESSYDFHSSRFRFFWPFQYSPFLSFSVTQLHDFVRQKKRTCVLHRAHPGGIGRSIGGDSLTFPDHRRSRSCRCTVSGGVRGVEKPHVLQADVVATQDLLFGGSVHILCGTGLIVFSESKGPKLSINALMELNGAQLLNCSTIKPKGQS